MKTSKFLGVRKEGNKWRAEICHKGKKISCGMHSSEEDAAKAYDTQAAIFGKVTNKSLNLYSSKPAPVNVPSVFTSNNSQVSYKPSYVRVQSHPYQGCTSTKIASNYSLYKDFKVFDTLQDAVLSVIDDFTVARVKNFSAYNITLKIRELVNDKKAIIGDLPLTGGKFLQEILHNSVLSYVKEVDSVIVAQGYYQTVATTSSGTSYLEYRLAP